MTKSPTDFFVLSCVLVSEQDWLPNLDSLVDLRRALRTTYGIATRPEIKATDIVGNRGLLRALSKQLTRKQRIDLFEQLLDYQSSHLNLNTFAIAVEKAAAAAKGWPDPRFAAWTFALQRINRFCQRYGEWATI